MIADDRLLQVPDEEPGVRGVAARRGRHLITHTGAMRRTPRLLTVLATTLLPGCYRYAPIAGTRADEGIEVRVRLTDTGAVALAPMIGVQVESVGGRIVAAADSAFTLAITETTNRAGATTSWSGERVVVPRAAVAELERRALDRRRSTIGGGLLVAAVAIAITTFDLTGSGGGSARSGGGGSPR